MTIEFEEGEYTSCAEVLDDWFGDCNMRGTAQMYTHEFEDLLAAMRRIEMLGKARIKELELWNAAMVEKAASGGTLDGYREMAMRIEDLEREKKRLRRGIDDIKIHGYETGQPDLHDMALALLQQETNRDE